MMNHFLFPLLGFSASFSVYITAAAVDNKAILSSFWVQFDNTHHHNPQHENTSVQRSSEPSEE